MWVKMYSCLTEKKHTDKNNLASGVFKFFLRDFLSHLFFWLPCLHFLFLFWVMYSFFDKSGLFFLKSFKMWWNATKTFTLKVFFPLYFDIPIDATTVTDVQPCYQRNLSNGADFFSMLEMFCFSAKTPSQLHYEAINGTSVMASTVSSLSLFVTVAFLEKRGVIDYKGYICGHTPL